MKIISSILMAGLSVFAMHTASAFQINLGQGNFGSGSHYSKSVDISLDPLVQNALYDVTCNIIDPDAQAFPVVARFDVNVATSGPVLFDGKPLVTRQQQLTDNNEHTVKFLGVSVNWTGYKLTFTWLGGDGVADPIHYSCFASPAFGVAAK
jgi:hypothetical protein